ncbi:MAG: alpha/beta fold hydrolase [Gammaproteobacteria bacterium]
MKSKTAFELNGPAEAPVVVLIHGIGLDRNLWRVHAAALANHYRVLTYDLWGHGDSPPPSAPLSLTLFSQQLLDLLDEIGIKKCALVGFSLGGMINRRLAMDYPHRVSALAIFNSPHQRSVAAQKLAEERAAQTAQSSADTVGETMERWFTPDFRIAHPYYMQQMRQQLLDNDAAVYAQCRQVLATGVLELIRPQPPLSLPALVITSENDRGSLPSMAFAIAHEIDGAQTVIVPRLQHMGLVEEPSAFIAPLLHFLDTTIALQKAAI